MGLRHLLLGSPPELAPGHPLLRARDTLWQVRSERRKGACQVLLEIPAGPTFAEHLLPASDTLRCVCCHIVERTSPGCTYSCFSTERDSAPTPREHLATAQAFLIVTAGQGRGRLASGLGRPGMLLNFLQFAGKPLTTKNDLARFVNVPRPRNPTATYKCTKGTNSKLSGFPEARQLGSGLAMCSPHRSGSKAWTS